jgi:hypothetical protein
MDLRCNPDDHPQIGGRDDFAGHQTNLFNIFEGNVRDHKE